MPCSSAAGGLRHRALKHNLFGYNAFDRNPWSSPRASGRTAGDPRRRREDPRSVPVAERPVVVRLHDAARRERYYASDVHWADKIAVAREPVDRSSSRCRSAACGSGRPSSSDTARGRTRLVSAGALDGAARRRLPPRHPVPVRWTPLELVEADPADRVRAGDAVDVRSAPRPRRAHRRLALAGPARPGVWRLDVEARDSDGRALPRTDRPPIRSLSVRVTAPRRPRRPRRRRGGSSPPRSATSARGHRRLAAAVRPTSSKPGRFRSTHAAGLPPRGRPIDRRWLRHVARRAVRRAARAGRGRRPPRRRPGRSRSEPRRSRRS